MTAMEKLAIWCVTGGSAILSGEATSMPGERAVVGLGLSLGNDVQMVTFTYVVRA